MAGDWIKMRVDLTDDPSVLRIASLVDMDEFAVIGRLHKLWSWADRHTTNGVTQGVDLKWVDRYVMAPGFAAALQSVGWVAFNDDVLSFPGFEIHNGASAKARCDAVVRQRQSRARHSGVTNNGDARVTIPKPFVRFVMKRDNYQCVYCGEASTPEKEESRKAVLSIDHILPFSRYGKQAVEDLCTCCKKCNGEKSDRTPQEWGMELGFLQDGLVFTGTQVVTKKCDTVVTNPLPEKRREEEIREDYLNTHPHPSVQVDLLGESRNQKRSPMAESFPNERAAIHGIEIDGDVVMYSEDPLRWEAAFISWWNTLPGVSKRSTMSLDTSQRRKLRDRLSEGDWFWKRTQAAFPLWTPTTWNPTIGKFLDPDTVTDILDGKYREQKRRATANETNEPVMFTEEDLEDA